MLLRKVPAGPVPRPETNAVGERRRRLIRTWRVERARFHAYLRWRLRTVPT